MTKPTGNIHTRNITKVARLATDRDVADGVGWYAAARDVAGEIATETGRTLVQAVGVIAVCSPLNGWANNLRIARHILATGDTSRGYLPLGLTLSRQILDGVDPRSIIKGEKVRNFYLAISTGGDEGLVIDRHAFDIAAGKRYRNDERPDVGVGRYRAASEAYRRATPIIERDLGVSLTDARSQALSWVVWRRLHGIAYED